MSYHGIMEGKMEPPDGAESHHLEPENVQPQSQIANGNNDGQEVIQTPISPDADTSVVGYIETNIDEDIDGGSKRDLDIEVLQEVLQLNNEKEKSVKGSEAKSSLSSYVYTRRCAIQMYSIGAPIFVICFILLLTFGVRNLGPYMEYQNMLISQCTVMDSSYTGDWINCGCTTESCRSRFPCLQLRVEVENKEGDRWWQYTALLFESEKDLTENNQCTINLDQCSVDEDKNEAKIIKYNSTWGAFGQKYDCLADPDSDAYVIRKLAIKGGHVFHSIFWPGFFAILALLMVVITFVLEGCSIKHEGYFFQERKCCREKPPKTVDLQAEEFMTDDDNFDETVIKSLTTLQSESGILMRPEMDETQDTVEDTTLQVTRNYQLIPQDVICKT